MYSSPFVFKLTSSVSNHLIFKGDDLWLNTSQVNSTSESNESRLEQILLSRCHRRFQVHLQPMVCVCGRAAFYIVPSANCLENKSFLWWDYFQYRFWGGFRAAVSTFFYLGPASRKTKICSSNRSCKREEGGRMSRKAWERVAEPVRDEKIKRVFGGFHSCRLFR